MRTVHRLKNSDPRSLLNSNGIKTANQFTWQNSAQELLNGL